MRACERKSESAVAMGVGLEYASREQVSSGPSHDYPTGTLATDPSTPWPAGPVPGPLARVPHSRVFLCAMRLRTQSAAAQPITALPWSAPINSLNAR